MHPSSDAYPSVSSPVRPPGFRLLSTRTHLTVTWVAIAVTILGLALAAGGGLLAYLVDAGAALTAPDWSMTPAEQAQYDRFRAVASGGVITTVIGCVVSVAALSIAVCQCCQPGSRQPSSTEVGAATTLVAFGVLFTAGVLLVVL